MDGGLAIAVLAALAVVITIIGFWRLFEIKRQIQNRLDYRTNTTEAGGGIFRKDDRAAGSMFRWITNLTEQAGYDNARASVILLLTGACAVIATVAAWRHTGGIVAGVLSGLIAGSLPYLYLLRKRHKRLNEFEQQFPEALDMMTRSIRAGYALTGAIQLVGEQMPDPVGQEFRRVFEETRLGLDPGEALLRISHRVPLEDTGFFCTTIGIQRIGGGNLAETLDRLAEVIRERFKVLKQARVLSAQHRWTAICVGLSPLVFALVFELTHPGYFDPLLNSPHASFMITAGIVLEVIGFFAIWRIADIEV
jgi:tight adherence protein B